MLFYDLLLTAVDGAQDAALGATLRNVVEESGQGLGLVQMRYSQTSMVSLLIEIHLGPRRTGRAAAKALESEAEGISGFQLPPTLVIRALRKCTYLSDKEVAGRFPGMTSEPRGTTPKRPGLVAGGGQQRNGSDPRYHIQISCYSRFAAGDEKTESILGPFMIGSHIERPTHNSPCSALRFS